MESRGFDWILPELAVGGRVDCALAAALVRDHRIGAVIDLRAEDRDDAELLRAAGISFLHLPTIDCEGVSAPMLRAGVAFARRHLDRGRRVLIHCEHGIGRSAVLALCVL